MSISLPKPNIEPAPGEALDEKRLREALKDVQRALETIKAVVPINPQDLSDSSKELFLQLVTAADRKITWSNTVITASGGQTANKEIEHGLGTTPSVVVATMSSRDINVSTFSYGATKFTAEIRDITGANISSNQEVHWIAIG